MMASIRPPSHILTRRIHVSAPICNLLAPPDPVSHMRPIIYSDVPQPAPPSLIRHPYSLAEFSATAINPGQDSALHFRLCRRQLDDFHHQFWFDSNTRFTVAKQTVLASLPPSASTLDKEKTLSEFYRQWYLQEADLTTEYTTEWRRRNLALIKLAVQIELKKLAIRLYSLFSLEKR